MSHTLVPYPYLCSPCKQARDFQAGRANYSAMIALKLPVPCEDCQTREKARLFHVNAAAAPLPWAGRA